VPGGCPRAPTRLVEGTFTCLCATRYPQSVMSLPTSPGRFVPLCTMPTTP
jgi:hypothetical protein